jgi:hypothetical protein
LKEDALVGDTGAEKNHAERRFMKTAALLLFLCAVFMTVASCGGYAHVGTPTTDGFHSKLPAPYTRAVVWGGRLDIMQSTSTWLSKKGVLVVDQTIVLQAAAEQKVTLTENKNLETDILRLARSVGARLVVFSNAEVGTLETGLLRRRVYSARVAVRAVDVNTGEIEWIGGAQSSERFSNMEEGITLLTCHALATAWDMRKPGAVAPANICPPGSGLIETQ